MKRTLAAKLIAHIERQFDKRKNPKNHSSGFFPSAVGALEIIAIPFPMNDATPAFAYGIPIHAIACMSVPLDRG